MDNSPLSDVCFAYVSSQSVDCVLMYISLMISEVENLFVCLLAISMSYLKKKKKSIQILWSEFLITIFKLNCLCFAIDILDLSTSKSIVLSYNYGGNLWTYTPFIIFLKIVEAVSHSLTHRIHWLFINTYKICIYLNNLISTYGDVS